MLRYAFLALLAIHGLIHLLGFVKAFQLAEVAQLSKSITRPAGILWLLATLLFLVTAILYLMRSSLWAFPGLAAIILSQVLILGAWSDAKAGTIANLIILLAVLPALGGYFFSQMVRAEQDALIREAAPPTDKALTNEDIAHLPPIVRTWLIRSNVVGRPRATFVRLKQSGQMRTKPDAGWMPFTAEQYVDVTRGDFIWTTRASLMPLIYMDGRDKYIGGEGEMLIKLLSLVPVVNDGHNEQMNSGSALRYLGEMCWFPSAALEPFVVWESIDSLHAKATLMTLRGPLSGTYTFTPEGDLASFEAERYYGGGANARLLPWRVTATAWTAFDGLRIPYKHEVTWRLPEGDFTWLTLEITDLSINNRSRYAD
jgi:hypothetical protein